jgi:RNA polymerase sigma-70 factor (ECF subfamily)
MTDDRAAARWAEDPEVKLMLRVQRGDPAAFSQLVARYWSQVFGRFYRRLGDRQEAEDLTQDVFLRLYRYRDRYQPRAKFATWLYHITQNVARNAVRSRRRHPCLSLGSMDPGNSDELATEVSLADRGDSPSRPMERAEVARAVRSALSGLGRRQRRALELHQFDDRTYVQVAEELDMSPKAAKSLLYRARNQLRVILSPLVGSSE